jgi:hypothetical protein
MEIDWDLEDNLMDQMTSMFAKIAEPMEEYKELRRFRSPITREEGPDTPLYKKKKHPKLVIRDGVIKEAK